MKKIFAAALAVTTLGAQAGGFEKGVSWGADMNGRGGAGISSLTGPAALYFNPAGMQSQEGFAATLQFSPSWIGVNGPAVVDGQSVDATKSMIPFAGLLGTYGLNERTTLGLGVYAAGGLRAAYEGLDLTSYHSSFDGFTGTTKSELTMIEASLGGAYRVMPGLKVGAGWRANFVTGNFSSTSVVTTDLGATAANSTFSVATVGGLKDLAGQNYAGFRIGAQYQPEGAMWGVGLNLRTPVAIKLKGQTFASQKGAFTGQSILSGLTATNAANTAVEATGAEGTVESTLPTLLVLGSHFDVMDKKVRLHLAYAWANYKQVDKIGIDGKFTSGAVVSDTQAAQMTANGAGTLATSLQAAANNKEFEVPDFETSWKDEHTVRLGVECMAVENWILRTGYAVSTAVVPADKGRATFSAPGVGHAVTAGAGTSFLEGKLMADLAMDYSWQSGTITASAANGNIGGTQKTTAFGLHTGVTYLF